VLHRVLPFLLWWPDVTRASLRADALAGLTGAIVVLPQGVAFAAIAGLPPEYGLYAAMVPAVIAALFGSSRLMMSGPTTPASIVLFSTLAALAVPGSATYIYYALTLTFMVGLVQLAMGVARMGHLVDFISDSVIVGFSAGAGVLIAVSQAKDFLGVELPRGLNLYEVITGLWQRAAQIDWMTVEVGVVSLAAGLLARRRLPAVPYMLVAMVAGGVLAFVFNAFLHGDIALLSVSAAALPPVSSPGFSFLLWQQLAPAALAVTFFALTQTVSISRALAARTGDRVDANQEFIGQGLSNLCGAFFSGYVSTGSFNRSAVNYEAGARTPLSSLFAAALLVLLLLVVAPLLSYMPSAATAAVLFLVAAGIIDVAAIRKILRASRPDAAVLVTTFLATVLLSLDFAILLGVLVSLVIFLNQSSRPRILVRVPDPRSPKRRFNTDPALPECPQLKIIRIDGPLFFGAANYVAERLRVLLARYPAQRHLLILARTMNFIDAVGAEMLARESRQRRALGGGVYLHQVTDEARGILRRGGYEAEIGADHFFDHKGEAIATIFDRLDRNVCASCTRRIFNECKTLPRPSPDAGADSSVRRAPERARARRMGR
jgi:SulP family sulfate permease